MFWSLAGIFAYSFESSGHSVSNHLLSPLDLRLVLVQGLPRGLMFPFHTPQGLSVLGFAFGLQARRDNRPNRVHFRYGLVVLLPMLSTSPHGDAVSVGYKVQTQL